jgi:hypothetical protein
MAFHGEEIPMAESPSYLGLAECAALLGIPSAQLRGDLRASLEQVTASRDDRGRPLWVFADVYRWAAVNLPQVANRIPVTFWPRAASPALYVEAKMLGQSAVALCWETQLGPLWLAWDYPGNTDATLATGAGAFPGASAIAVVGGDFGRDGPAVWAVLPGALSESVYEIEWSDLSDVLGQPLPYWAFALRVPEVLLTWKPGTPAVLTAAIPVLDPAPVLRLAALVEQGCPAQRTLLNLALSWQSRATGDAEQDLDIAQRTATPETLAVAAAPMPTPEVSVADLDEAVRRAGWLEILGRRDHLAALCVRQMMAWNGGSDFPWSNPASIDIKSRFAREWERRLVPAPRTALIDVLDPEHSAIAILMDPETDAPVIRTEDGSLLAAMPQRLPTTSPLAELILERPIWVRTEDGTLYPAPRDHYFGLNWGYSGSGPGSLALLAHRLLDDIATPGADDINGAAPGLEELMLTK